MSPCVCMFKTYSNSLLRAIIVCNHLPFLKIFSNFVQFSNILPFFNIALPFFWKIAPTPSLSKISPDVIHLHHIWQYWSHHICSLHVLFHFFYLFIMKCLYTSDTAGRIFEIALISGSSIPRGRDENFAGVFSLGGARERFWGRFSMIWLRVWNWLSEYEKWYRSGGYS